MAKENGSAQSPADAAKTKLDAARAKFTKMSDKEQRAIVAPLLKNYDAANAKLEAARTATDKAMAERSDIVRQLGEVGVVGLKRNGKQLMVQSRSNKSDPEAPPTWFFRGEKEVDLPEY
jgi:hypothetical protein